MMEALKTIENALEMASKHGVFGLKENYAIAQDFSTVVTTVNQLNLENKNLKATIEKLEGNGEPKDEPNAKKPAKKATK